MNDYLIPYVQESRRDWYHYTTMAMRRHCIQQTRACIYAHDRMVQGLMLLDDFLGDVRYNRILGLIYAYCRYRYPASPKRCKDVYIVEKMEYLKELADGIKNNPTSVEHTNNYDLRVMEYVFYYHYQRKHMDQIAPYFERNRNLSDPNNPYSIPDI